MNNKQQLVDRHIKEMEKHTRKQKLREARRKTGRKNQPKKPRQKKLSINNWDELDEFEFSNFSPIMPPGSKEQRDEIARIASREINKTDISADEDQGSISNVLGDRNSGSRCLVIEAGSSMCRVDYEGQSLLCNLRGNVKDADTGYVNPVAVGDWVLVNHDGSGRGIVETVLPRRSVLARPYSPDQGKILEDLYQIVVANVDRLLIVASWREPYIWPALIDRYLITAQRNQIEAVICINKIDLIENREEFDEMVKVYESLNHKLILTSATTGVGIESLKDFLRNGTTVLAGLSGVGKSTLLTAVQPSLEIRTGEVSSSGLFTGQGRHTTTQSKLWKLEGGGVVIDTPGVRTFGLAGISPSSLANWYPEIISHVQSCRFSNCTHLKEPGCAVMKAVEVGFVSQLRYKNYTQLYEELSSI